MTILLAHPAEDEVARLAAALHRHEAHPDYEYAVASGIALSSFNSSESVIDGWVRNFAFPDADDDAEHWMRLRDGA